MWTPVQAGSHCRLVALAAALVLFLVSGGVRAEPASPAHLPPLQPDPAMVPASQADQSVRLQLHQRLEYPFDGSPAHLSLGPSVTWNFHAPSAAAQAERQVLTRQLAALEQRERLQHEALSGHLTYLRLQHSLWTAGLVDGFITALLGIRPGWATHDPAGAAAATAEPAYRSLLQARIDHAGAELNAIEQLRSLALEEPGISAMPEATWRPRLDPLPMSHRELEAACIGGNQELRRWMLLEAEDAAVVRAARSEAELHGQLTLSASLGIGGGRDPSLSWRASARFAPANSGVFSLELEVSERSAAQSAQFGTAPTRPELTEPEEGMWERARQDIHFRLSGLAEAWSLAGETEALHRLLHVATITRITGPPSAGQQATSDLTDALNSARDLLNASVQHDALTLELAVACGLDVAWELTDYLDTAVLSATFRQ